MSDLAEPGAAGSAPNAAKPNRWRTILFGFIGVVAILQGANSLYHLVSGPSLDACDSSAARETIDSIYKDKAKAGATLSDITEVGTADGVRTCKAKVVLDDAGKSSGHITYTLQVKDGSENVHITEAKSD